MVPSGSGAPPADGSALRSVDGSCRFVFAPCPAAEAHFADHVRLRHREDGTAGMGQAVPPDRSAPQASQTSAPAGTYDEQIAGPRGPLYEHGAGEATHDDRPDRHVSAADAAPVFLVAGQGAHASSAATRMSGGWRQNTSCPPGGGSVGASERPGSVIRCWSCLLRSWSEQCSQVRRVPRCAWRALRPPWAPGSAARRRGTRLQSRQPSHGWAG